MKMLLKSLVWSCLSLACKASQIPLQLSLEVQSYQIYQSSDSPLHSLRIRKQKDDLCDAHGAQYTGWLDVGPKHLFFWYFESRTAPKDDPLVLWLTGGPGVSSMLGLFEELGPCLINKHGNGTVHNPHGWNKHANMLFVDQPADVGFSYLDGDAAVPSTSWLAAEDMHIFLQLFVSKAFPAMKDRPFHISGESYGGHYVPVLGAQIMSQNALYPARTQINLKSVLIGNGFFSPLDTAFGYWETLCTTKPGVEKPFFNSTVCDTMAANMPRCLELAKVCYEYPDPAICEAGREVCWNGVIKFYDGNWHNNRFDISKKCAIPGLCYAEAERIQNYLNSTKVLEALGAKNYKIESEKVSTAFGLAGDEGTTTEPQVLYLLGSGIDVLIYQGVLDLACNTAGNLKWANNMPWKGQTEFASKDLGSWHMDGKAVGTFKDVSIDMGARKPSRLAFLTVSGAGHMVPQDKPEAALEMMTRWISGKKFS